MPSGSQTFFMISDPKCEKIGIRFGSCEQTWPAVEVSDYHLIFDFYGFLMVTSEGQTKFWPVVLRPGLKELLFTCVNKFIVYTWSSIMKRNFLRHLNIIAKKTSILLCYVTWWPMDIIIFLVFYI